MIAFCHLFIIVSIALLASLAANWYLARAIAFLQQRYECVRDNARVTNDANKRWITRWDKAKAENQQLRRRVKELEPALAECVAGLRRIAGPMGTCHNLNSVARRRIAHDVLTRIQIPDDGLPTESLPGGD